jgi:hypothetical protein
MTFLHGRLVYVGNLDSVLFRQRIVRLQELLGAPDHMVLDTGRRNRSDILRFLLDCTRLIAEAYFSPKPLKIVLHGAYSSVLWSVLILPGVRAVSILQGSELNVDFCGLRARLVRLILRSSALVVCRNEAQRELAIDLCNTQTERCICVNWGLKGDLFDLPLQHRSGDPVLISPRATQPEYNIPVIFAAVAELKKKGYRLRFIYVRFNPTVVIEDTSAADEVLEAPAQSVLWEKVAKSDLCISVPDYDGLSNTVLETLALGSTPLYSDLPPYAFLKQDVRLGIGMALGASFEQNVQRLQLSIQRALSCLGELRSSATFRRDFAEKHFRAGAGVDRIVAELRA